jgi:hypothetical protein
MRELPKLNKVAVDDEPEPKPERDRDCIPYLIVLAALICRLILNCCEVHVPLVTSWQGCWITIVLVILGSKVVLYLEKKYDNEKLPLYYVCASVSFWGLFVSMNYHFWILIFSILIIFVIYHVFQSLLTRKK